MKRSGTAALLLGLLLFAGELACDRSDPAGAKRKGRGGRRGAAAVEVVPVRRGALHRGLGFPGELKAPEQVELAAKIAGRLRRVAVAMGQRVKRGQLLARLDDRQLRAQLREARAAHAVAQVSVDRARVDQRTARVELKRNEPLAKKDLITRQELDNLRSRRDAANAALALARAQVSQAGARVALLRQQLADTRVAAPFDGWVQKRHLDAGAVVSPGTAILQLVRTDPIVARFLVGERHVGAIRSRVASGKPAVVTVETDAYPGGRFAGKVVRVAPALEPESRAVAVEAELPNGDGRLMPGMYCRVRLSLGSLASALLVPLRALVDDPARDKRRGRSRSAVYVVEGDRARLKKITLGAIDQGQGEVLDGLEEGQRVVVEGRSALSDGARVRVVEAPQSRPAR